MLAQFGNLLTNFVELHIMKNVETKLPTELYHLRRFWRFKKDGYPNHPTYEWYGGPC